MCVDVDEAGKDRGAAEIDEGDVLRRRRAHLVERTDLANAPAVDPDPLIRAIRAGANIEQSARFDERCLGCRLLRGESDDECEENRE